MCTCDKAIIFLELTSKIDLMCLEVAVFRKSSVKSWGCDFSLSTFG